jgi:hypothetical protein
MVALPTFVGSAVLTALIVTETGEGYGVAYRPLSLTVPTTVFPFAMSFTVHFTVVAYDPVPLTLAENCRLSPGAKVIVAGATLTLEIAFTVGGTVIGATDPPPPLPHAAQKEIRTHERITATDLCMPQAFRRTSTATPINVLKNSTASYFAGFSEDRMSIFDTQELLSLSFPSR